MSKPSFLLLMLSIPLVFCRYQETIYGIMVTTSWRAATTCFLRYSKGGEVNRIPDMVTGEKYCPTDGYIDDHVDPCHEPFAVVGTCEAAIPSWSYNQETGECEYFEYGGCNGTNNKFHSQQECEDICETTADPCSEPFALLDCEALPFCFMGNESDPPVLGPCNAYMPTWSYNQETGNCEYFIYGGCGANNNIFYNQQECSETCETTVDPCSEPFGIEADPPCEAFYPTWSYNQDTGKCEKWIYGGCGGNNNRFEGTKGMKECQETCETTSAAGLDDLEQLCSLDNDIGKRNVQIVDKINQYRSEIGKQQLKCTGALVSTAEHHTRNQMDVNPSSGGCNLHSWLSDKYLGKGGKKCCYKNDHSNPNCMWKKPKEILGWDGGYGYEISYASSGGAKPDEAFKAWRHSSGHNDVLASNGMWKSLTKVGCYYEGNYANCWFAM